MELFTLLEPRLDLVLIGVGHQVDLDAVRARVAKYFKKHRMGFEVMLT